MFFVLSDLLISLTKLLPKPKVFFGHQETLEKNDFLRKTQQLAVQLPGRING